MQNLAHHIISIITVSLLIQPAFSQEWRDITPSAGSAPSPRRNAAAIYDPVDHRVIVFSGKSAAGDLNDLWAFDLSSNEWAEFNMSQPLPEPRFTANGVYDGQNHRMLMWSGQGSVFFNDVWTFDLPSETWSEFSPPDPKPNIRYGAASVFDPIAGELVTFAGFTDSGRFDDTWRFDPGNVMWDDVAPTVHPGRRCLHSASYDSLMHRMIIYGGQNSGALEDIWAFDLNQNTWEDLTPEDSPDGRYFPTNVYDPVEHRILVFGGQTNSGTSAELLAFDLEEYSWTSVQTPDPKPSARYGASAVYVPSTRQMLLFGGLGQTLFNEVWALDLPVVVSVQPPAKDIRTFELVGNYPNPFNPSTTIRYNIALPSKIRLTIFNVRGERVATLRDEEVLPGDYQAVWNGRDTRGRAMPSGLYLLQLRSQNQIETKKMLLLK